MVYCTRLECGSSPTLDSHDIHCKYLSSISLTKSEENQNKNNDRWQITYPSLKQSSSSLFEQFVFIKILSSSNQSLLFEPLIRESCDYSFQTKISFKRSLSMDKSQIIYTVILPSCNTEAIELCTYYISIETSNSIKYELQASLGILLQFQQKYSYQSYINNNENNQTQKQPQNVHNNNIYESTNIYNETCIYSQFYGLKASLTDFPIGIIMQPEFIHTDGLFIINQFTSSPITEINVKQIKKLKGDAESESYDVPTMKNSYNSNEDYILLNIYYIPNENKNKNKQKERILPNIKYIIYSQSNISYIQVSVINSGGWFLMLILVFLILIAMCRKYWCLRNDQRLSYDDILQNITLLNSTYNNNNNIIQLQQRQANSDDSNELLNKSNKGITVKELNAVSTIEIYHKKIFYKSNKTNKYKSCCICLYDYKNNDRIRKLKCNHYFHQQCIDIWFKRNIQCPLCKQCIINAHILSKRSDNSVSISVSVSVSTSTTASSTTNLISDDSHSESDCETNSSDFEFAQSDNNNNKNNNNNNNIEQQKYSLSDSHCIVYKKHKYLNRNNSNVINDDLYIGNSNIRNRHSQSSFSGQSHHSSSSNASEIVYNNLYNNNNNNTNTNTTTNTSNISTNDISLSSPITNNNVFGDDLPLSTFISQSLSSHKKQ